MWWFRTTIALLAWGCFLTAIDSAHAGWGIPNLNPFSSDEKKPAGPQKPDSGWHLPSLPGFGSKSKPVTRPADKSMLTKTKETLFPWTRKPAAPAKLTGTRKTYEHNSTFASETRGSEKSGKSFFSSWFSSADDDRKVPMAPHEWLGQPMPE